MSCSHKGEMLRPHRGKIKDYEGKSEQAQREKAREKRSEKLHKAKDNEAQALREAIAKAQLEWVSAPQIGFIGRPFIMCNVTYNYNAGGKNF